LNLNFAAVNTNSLNVSSSKKDAQKHKLYGIAKLRSDIIFLSDIRVGESENYSNEDPIRHTLKFNPYRSYDCVINSKKNSRGVAILLATDISYKICDTFKDTDENILLLKIELERGTCLTIGAVYGPNSRDNRFFDLITEKIRFYNSEFVILGGDWNCVPNGTHIDVNVDCLNMVNLPNSGQTANILNFIATNNLVDAFRIKYPLLKDYSYVPYGTIRKNRARLDYFLINESAAAELVNCSIGDTMISKSFDHKPVTCVFKKPHKKRKGALKIGKLLLKDPDAILIAKLATIETYVNNIDPVVYGEVRVQRARAAIGNCWNLLHLAGPNKIHLLNWQRSEDDELHRDELITQILEIMNGFDLDLLETLPLLVTASNFYVNLTMAIKNEITSYQAFVWRCRNESKDRLRRALNDCKITGNTTTEAYFNIETDLTRFVQYELDSEFEQSPLFESISNEKASRFLTNLAKGTKKPTVYQRSKNLTVQALSAIVIGTHI